jgi:hypothetical protein
MERDFKGVWIPKEIWLDENLACLEKVLLVEIDSLTKNGECFASNAYLAKFLGISKQHVSRLISNLVRKDYIEIALIYKKGTKEIEKRVITPIRKNADTLYADLRIPSTQDCLDPLRKNADTPIRKNAEDNNTSLNNTINNTVNNKNNKKENSLLIEKEFEKIWTLYPRKIGKKKSFDAFKKARKTKKISYETIENGLYRYIRYLEQQGTGEQYIMHGSTWFGQEKWQDEYILTGINQKPKNINEYMKQKYGDGGVTDEPPRDRKIVNDYDKLLPDCFQGF